MDCGANCLRYLLFAFNLIFVLLGIVVAVFGGLLLAADSTNVRHAVMQTLDTAGTYQTMGVVLLVIGIVVVIIAGMGCCGALRKSYCLLVGFCLIVIIIVVAEVVVGAVILTNRSATREELSGWAFQTLAKTNSTDRTYSAVWNITQEDLHCCGVNATEDWVNTNGTWYYNRDTAPLFPDSCCKNKTDGCSLVPGVETWEEGCIGEVEKRFKGGSLTLGLVAIIIGMVEILGVIIAWCVATQVKREERAGY